MERYTEFFYLQPHGLFYQLKGYTPHHPYADPPPAEIVSNNIVFWQTFEKRQLLDLVAKINPPTPPHNASLVQGFLNTLYFWPEADPESLKAGAYYANVLNDWGVELQKEGRLSAAGKYFAEALLLNPQNAAARINQNYYADLRAHRPYNWLTPAETAANLGVYRDWRHVTQDGLVDDPNFCYMLGSFMSEANLFRPALAQYKRVKELAPDHFETYVGMAGVFLKSHDLTNLISNAAEMMRLSPTNELGMMLKVNGCIELKDFQKAIPLLDQLLSLDASNSVALLNRAIAYRGEGKRDAAQSDFEKVTQITPDAFQAYFSLAEMAEEKTNHAAAITNYELFLDYAPTNAPQIADAKARLEALTKKK
jgi:tetratricopeptide (TPR) repeat protein